jgi:hypothetical protein
MNPEAGFIQGPFRAAVERITRENPTLKADEVIRRARGAAPTGQETASAPLPAPATTEQPMEFDF